MTAGNLVGPFCHQARSAAGTVPPCRLWSAPLAAFPDPSAFITFAVLPPLRISSWLLPEPRQHTSSKSWQAGSCCAYKQGRPVARHSTVTKAHTGLRYVVHYTSTAWCAAVRFVMDVCSGYVPMKQLLSAMRLVLQRWRGGWGAPDIQQRARVWPRRFPAAPHAKAMCCHRVDSSSSFLTPVRSLQLATHPHTVLNSCRLPGLCVR